MRISPEPLINAARRIQIELFKAGYQTLAAGGCVRDAILGRPCHDVDLATEANPDQIRSALAGYTVIDTGIKHGTVTVIENGHPIEVTTLRTDKTTYGRKADVVFVKSFQEDAKRRDFTVNALFMDLTTFQVFDYVGGQEDLSKKLIRYVGDPSTRIREDFLRILRFFRFKSTLNLTPEAHSLEASLRYIPYLSYISQERIREEVLKLLVGPGVEHTLLTCKPLFFHIFQELIPCDGFPQNSPYHIYDVYTHMVKGVGFLAQFGNPILSLAHLFHDIAKPFCHSRDLRGVDHFYGHEVEGQRIAHNMAHRLKLPKRDSQLIEFLILNHMALHQPNGPKGFRRLIARCSEFGPNTLDLLLKIYEADCRGMNLTLKMPEFERVRAELLDYVTSSSSVSRSNWESPLTGDELMKRFHLNPGPLLGQIKSFLKNSVIDGDLDPQNEDEVIEAVEIFLEKQKMKGQN